MASNDEETTHTPSQFPHSSDVAHAERHPVHGQLADICPSEHEGMASYGKLSTVASQNLSIIVEAINHLEGDKHLTASEKVRVTTARPSHSDQWAYSPFIHSLQLGKLRWSHFRKSTVECLMVSCLTIQNPTALERTARSHHQPTRALQQW